MPQLALLTLFTTGLISRSEGTHRAIAALAAGFALIMISLTLAGVIHPDLRR